jgi:hypothetical protein
MSGRRRRAGRGAPRFSAGRHRVAGGTGRPRTGRRAACAAADVQADRLRRHAHRGRATSAHVMTSAGKASCGASSAIGRATVAPSSVGAVLVGPSRQETGVAALPAGGLRRRFGRGAGGRRGSPGGAVVPVWSPTASSAKECPAAPERGEQACPEEPSAGLEPATPSLPSGPGPYGPGMPRAARFVISLLTSTVRAEFMTVDDTRRTGGIRHWPPFGPEPF